jgi:arylsulfatase A-like enzyme
MEQSQMRHYKAIYGCLFVAVLLGCLAYPAANARADGDAPPLRPNIVIIISDDLDYGKLGYTGYDAVDTPQMDSIIRGGTYFTDGYVSGPVCAPTRAGLMTGRYQARYGYETLTGPITRQIEDDYGVDTREILLPELLRRAGYATGVVGKWHLGYNDKYHPNNRGVDYFFGFLAGGHDYFVWDTPPKSTTGGPILRNKEKADGQGYLTEAFATEAADFISRHKDGPLFLYYAPFNVHGPHVVPDKYLPKSGDVMAGMVKALDDSVGVILGALKDAKLEHDTLIVYVNDNGGTGTNVPFRGRKGQLYEGGIRVPFAVRWPGRVPAGRRCEQPVIQLDILPTVLAAAGVKLSSDRQYDGVDLLPYLTGEKSDLPHRELFWRYPRFGRAVRSGDLKLILHAKRAAELFDLSSDPGETTNVADRMPEAVKRLTAAIHTWERRMVPLQ